MFVRGYERGQQGRPRAVSELGEALGEALDVPRETTVAARH